MPTQKGVIQGSHQQAQWKITKREQRAQRHERPETGMSVHAFLSLEYRTPLRIRLEMNGKKEGTVEGLMRNAAKHQAPIMSFGHSSWQWQIPAATEKMQAINLQARTSLTTDFFYQSGKNQESSLWLPNQSSKQQAANK